MPEVEGHGYYFSQRAMLPYGVDYMLDINRLAAAWHVPINVVFDVGAHRGETSKAALDAFPNAVVHAFEPAKATYKQLTDAIHNPRFTAHNIALADGCGKLEFYEYESTLHNSLVPNPPTADAKAARTIVTATTLDTLCQRQGISRIDVLKIDAERCDLAVLRGGQNLLADRRIGFVYFEFNSMLPKPGITQSTLAEVGGLLSSFDMNFIATYTDRIEPDSMFVVANALFGHR